MKTSLPTISDDLGNRWLVEKSDPGARCIEAARALRIKNPVFPHEVLLGRPPDLPRWQDLNDMLGAQVLPLDELRRAYVANRIRAHLRGLWNKTDPDT